MRKLSFYAFMQTFENSKLSVDKSFIHPFSSTFVHVVLQTSCLVLDNRVYGLISYEDH